MRKILHQEHIISSDFNRDATLETIKTLVNSEIFTRLIFSENAGIRLTVTVEVIENESDLPEGM